MNNYLIYVKDNVENTHYIYTNELIHLGTDNFLQCYDWLKDEFRKKYPERNIDLRYIVSDKCCEIFCQEDFIQRGWIWNSTDTKRNVLYELTKIPVCFVHNKKNVSTMTENKQTSNFSMQTVSLVDYPVKSCIEKNYFEQIYNQQQINNALTCFDIDSKTDDVSSWMEELEPVIQNISKLNIGNNGYASNPFSPINETNPFLKMSRKEALKIELQKTLAKPNFGLRPIKE
jgi:hypothetical protein